MSSRNIRKGAQGHLSDSPTTAKAFGCTAKELQHLMEQRTSEAVAQLLKPYGGVLGLCEKLQTSHVEGEALPERPGPGTSEAPPPASEPPTASPGCGEGQIRACL